MSAYLVDFSFRLVQTPQGAVSIMAQHFQVDNALQNAGQQWLDTQPGVGDITHVSGAASLKFGNALADGCLDLRF